MRGRSKSRVRGLAALVGAGGRAWILAVLALCLGGWGRAGTPVDLGGARTPLAGHLAVLATGPEILEPSRLPAGAAFREVPGPVNLGFGKGVLWIRFEVEVPASGMPPRLLDIRPPFLEEVALFTPGPGGTWVPWVAGRTVANPGAGTVSGRAVFDLSRRAWPGPGPATCYLRVRTRTTWVVDPVLWRPEVFAAAEGRRDLFFGLYYGLAAFMALAYGVLWLRLGGRAYVLYSALVLSLGLIALQMNGHLQLLAPGLGNEAAHRLGMASMGLLLGTSAHLPVALFLDRPGRAVRAAVGVFWSLGILSALATALGGYFHTVEAQHLGLMAMVAFSAGLALREARMGNALAGLYLLAFGPALVTAALRLVRNFGWAPSGILAEEALYVGTLGHIVLMNLPLVRKLTLLRQERDAARTEALALSKAREQELEAQVRERTLVISQRMAELEQALAKVRQLEGIIPICSYCKKIRDDQQSWHQLEAYIVQHTEASFSHGVCPDCRHRMTE